MSHSPKPDGDKRIKGLYVLSGGIPWPVFRDGTMYADSLCRVIHADAPENTGRIQSLEWTHPDGSYMNAAKREKVRKATVTLPERREPYPGVWMAVVSWDERDGHDRIKAKVRVSNLSPL